MRTVKFFKDFDAIQKSFDFENKKLQNYLCQNPEKKHFEDNYDIYSRVLYYVFRCVPPQKRILNSPENFVEFVNNYMCFYGQHYGENEIIRYIATFIAKIILKKN